MAECGVLAHGSLNSFHKGKNYKRCRKMHEILALSLESLHFEQFLLHIENEDEIEHVVKTEIEKIQENGDAEFVFSEEFSDLLKQYADFTEKTRKGQHGNCTILDAVYRSPTLVSYIHSVNSNW